MKTIMKGFTPLNSRLPLLNCPGQYLTGRAAPALRDLTGRAGTTLIEAVVYLALFSILMGGGVVAAYSLYESTDRNQTKLLLQEEGDFLCAKIDWALSGVQSVSSPLTGASASILTANKWDAAVGTVEINLSGSDIQMSRLGNTAIILNNSIVSVSDLVFAHSPGGAGGPESVRATFKVSAKAPNGMTVSQDFFTTKFLRK
jgi:hypothetical protein